VASSSLALCVAALITLLCVFLGSAAAESIGFGLTADWDEWLLQLLPQFLVFTPMIVAALALSLFWKQAQFHVGNCPLKSGLLGLAAGLGVGVFAAFVAVLSGNGKIIAGFPLPVMALPFTLFSIATLVQVIAEEMLFRGWLMPAIGKQLGEWWSLILSSALFCGIHVLSGASNPLGYINLFLGGLALGLIYLRTKGLIAPVLFHFGFNWSEEPLLGLSPGGGILPGRSLMDIDIFGGNLFGGGEDGVNTALAVTAGFLIVIAFVAWRWRIAKKSLKIVPKRRPEPKAEPRQAAQRPDFGQAVPPPAPEPESNSIIDAGTPAQTPKEPPHPTPPLPTVALSEPGGSVRLSSAMGPMATTLTATHQGAVRTVNEDRLFAAPHLGVWAVADGMGGHRFGDRASTLIVEHLDKMDARDTLEQQLAALHEAVTAANAAIYAEAQENGSRMGSTIVACVSRGDRLAFLWAGDSRAYRLRDGQLQQLTRDHTQVQELVERGELTADQAARHPMSHVLVRAVGVTAEIDLEISNHSIVDGDIILLCSDGIYDALDESEIVELLARRGDARDLTSMTELAVNQGARDNVTAIAIIPTQINTTIDRK
jgi:serine/threonine protein phosphatase Stp1